jgi:hypothetical protein
MKSRHTSIQKISASLILCAILAGCAGQGDKDSFLPDPAPETPAEMQAIVDSLRQVVRPSFTDTSPVAGTWEAMNVILTPVSVISQDEAFDIMGEILVYTRDKAVLFDHACDTAAYETREVTFDDYFLDHELSREELQLEPDPIEVITVSCGGERWNVSGAELVRVSRERLLILWDGSVIVLVPQVY